MRIGLNAGVRNPTLPPWPAPSARRAAVFAITALIAVVAATPSAAARSACSTRRVATTRQVLVSEVRRTQPRATRPVTARKVADGAVDPASVRFSGTTLSWTDGLGRPHSAPVA